MTLAMLAVATGACAPSATDSPTEVVSASPAAGTHAAAASATEAPKASATSAITETPAPTGTPFGSVEVPGGTNPMTVRLVGDQGVFTDWRPATREEIERQAVDVPDSDILLVRNDDGALLLAWAGGACDTGAVLAVAREALVLTEDPRPACDAIGITKGIILTPAAAVDPSKVDVTLVATTPTG